MEIKDLSDEELYAELELREVENNKYSLKGCSQIDIGRDSYMIDYNFLLLNATTGEHNGAIVEVEDVDVHNNVDLEEYMDEHGKINISIFDILNCMKIICGEDEYIAVCVEED